MADLPCFRANRARHAQCYWLIICDTPLVNDSWGNRLIELRLSWLFICDNRFDQFKMLFGYNALLVAINLINDEWSKLGFHQLFIPHVLNYGLQDLVNHPMHHGERLTSVGEFFMN